MPREKVCIDLKGLVCADADNRIYARLLEQRRAAPMHARVWVYDGDDALGDARFYEGIGAGRSLAVMGARLERNVNARAFGLCARHLEGICFAVGTPAI